MILSRWVVQAKQLHSSLSNSTINSDHLVCYNFCLSIFFFCWVLKGNHQSVSLADMSHLCHQHSWHQSLLFDLLHGHTYFKGHYAMYICDLYVYLLMVISHQPNFSAGMATVLVLSLTGRALTETKVRFKADIHF